MTAEETHKLAIDAAGFYNANSCKGCDKFYLEEDGTWWKGKYLPNGDIEQITMTFYDHSVIGYAKSLGWCG